MRHKVSGRKFDRAGDERKALFRGLVKDLMRHERIKTTEAKAKEVRPLAEKMITLGKDGTLHARRQALAYINDKDVVKKLFDEIAPRFADAAGRLHADHQARPARRRRRADGAARAGGARGLARWTARQAPARAGDASPCCWSTTGPRTAARSTRRTAPASSRSWKPRFTG